MFRPLSCRSIGLKYHHLAPSQQPTKNQQSTIVRLGSTSVRLIALQDLPYGKAYKGDVVTVKAGYARNYLIPKKIALYATPQNFERLGMVDPDVETTEQRLARLQQESSMAAGEEKYLREADLLKKYLRNKVLKLWRNVDPNSVDALHPGMVTVDNLREKLSRQLKIDLEEDESIHIIDTSSSTSQQQQPVVFAEMSDARLQSIVDDYQPSPPEVPCTMQIKRLGEYLAKISLKGGYSVPLRFVVLPR